jgi:hypothetical protein
MRFEFVVLAVSLFIYSCQTEEKILQSENPPSVLTNDVSNISFKNATLKGEVTNEGFSATLDRGFVYSDKNSNPSVSDSKVSSGFGKGVYSISLDNLTENTKYYFKAYATNSKGTSYGEAKSFNTLEIILTPPKDNFDYKNIIGKPLRVQNIEITQYSFPKQLNWTEANKACSALGKEWRLPLLADWKIINSNGYVWFNTYIAFDYNYFKFNGPNFEPGYWSGTELTSNNKAWIIYSHSSNSAFAESKLAPNICRCVRNF